MRGRNMTFHPPPQDQEVHGTCHHAGTPRHSFCTYLPNPRLNKEGTLFLLAPGLEWAVPFPLLLESQLCVLRKRRDESLGRRGTVSRRRWSDWALSAPAGA
jgi:hypothetical protein